MFPRFIVATDTSPASSAVVGCLGGLKEFGAKECLLIQCFGVGDAATAAYVHEIRRFEGMLNEQQAILEEQGFTVTVRTVLGAAKQEINRIAVDEDYSLIVIGSQGGSIIEERILGGVAYGVISRSRRPVLMVPIRKVPGEKDTCKPVCRCFFTEHVLYATDFSKTADSAFTYVERMVASGVQKVTLAHVQDMTKLEKHPESRIEEFDRLDLDRLENLKQSLLKQGAPEAAIELRHGVPAREIRQIAEDGDVQLVVMGTQGRGFFGEIFLGSVSNQVARASVAPVLLIPAKQA